VNQDNVRTLMTPETRRHWIRAVLASSEFSMASKTVLIALETFADYRDGTNAYPGEALLAEICNLTTRAVRSALARGRELGFIEQTRPANSRAGLAAVYRLLPAPQIAATTGTAVPVNNSTTGTAVPVNNLTTGTPTTPRPERPRHHDRNGRSSHPPCTTQVPTMVSESGTSPREPIAAHTPRAPSRFCEQHPQGTPENCGRCANARTAFTAWQEIQAEQDAAIAAADDLERRRRRRARESCPDCEGSNFRPDPDRDDSVIPCDHPNVPPEVPRVGYG